MPLINGKYYEDVLRGADGSKYGIDKKGIVHKIRENDIQSNIEQQLNAIKYNYSEITLGVLKKVCELSASDGHTLFVIFDNRDTRTNITTISHKDLASKLAMTIRSLSKHLSRLKNLNLIKTAPNLIYINPCLSKGSSSHRKHLLYKYLGKPMDTHHKVISGVNVYSKKQLHKIAGKIIKIKIAKSKVKISSRKSVWNHLLKQVINYSNTHYSQYGILNVFLTQQINKIINACKIKENKR